MTWILLAIGILLTLGTAIFVAAEFSLIALDKHTVEKQVAEGDQKAKSVLHALTHLSTNLSGAQVGITITTLVFGFAVKDPLTEVVANLLGLFNLDSLAIDTLAVTLAMIVSYAFSVIFGELIPKNLAISAPLATAKVVAPLQHWFTVLLKPLIVMFNATANFFLRLINIEPQEELSAARSPAELDSLVRHSAQAGTLETGTAVLLSRALQLTERTAADVMTHRGAMLSVEVDANAADILVLTNNSGHSRFPVIDGSEDDVVGIVQARQAVAIPRQRRKEVTAREIMSDVISVPETVGLDSLLLDLRSQGAQMAVVVDEYGGTAGIVTLEDVIEEIVGEVSDEHDVAEPQRFIASQEGQWIVSGLMRPDEIRRELGVVVPESPDYETLGGLIMDLLGRLAVVGDNVECEFVEFEVLSLDGRRIDQVKMKVLDSRALAVSTESGELKLAEIQAGDEK